MSSNREQSGGSVLLADDEPSVLYTLKVIFEQAGFHVDAVPSFAAARDHIQRSRYDAIVADIGLERQDLGLELAREAKRRKRAPVVLVYTDYPTVEQLRAAMTTAVDYVAFKPVDLDDMKSALARLIAHRRQAMTS